MRARTAIGTILPTLLLSLLAVRTARAGTGGFTFTPPPGWIDISRGAPEEQRKKGPPGLRAQADNPAIDYMAVDPANWDDGFVENMNAVVLTGKRALLPTLEGLTEMTKGIAEEAAKSGFKYRVVKTDLVKVAGVTSGRIVGEMSIQGTDTRLVQYVIPGEMSQATLTFTTTPANFAHYEPLFDAAAQATVGAVEARAGSSLSSSALAGGIAGGIGGGVAALFFALSKRRRAAAAAAKRSGSGPG
jgi:hypothetical protein